MADNSGEQQEPLPRVDPERRYPVAFSCDFLFLSRGTLYKKIGNGEIASIQDGRRRFIPGSELLRLSKAAA